MTIHDDADAARKAVYDTAFGKLQTSIDGLTLEKATLTGTVQELETERAGLLARIAELETKPVEPEPTPTPANPVPKKIYGPTGKHWPSRTPLPTSGGTVWYADPTWVSVADAITKASASSDPNAIVKIREGSLPGYGAGATAKTVLQNIGQTGRATKVLVIPADGKDSVTFTGSLRMHQVTNVAFVGFQLGEQYGIVATGCQEFSWAWSNARFTNVTNSDGAKTKNVEFVECVCVELGPLTSSDRNAIRNDDDSTSTTDGVSFIGGYIAPVQKKQGEAAHLDSLQLSGGNRFDNILLKDMPIFAASNQGVIATPTTTITLDHVLIVGGPSVHERYSRQEGAYVQQYEGSPWPLNGAPGAAKIQNESVIVGSVKGWGSAVYDASSGVLKTVDKAYLDAVAPVPTKSYLDSIWNI